jgi:hypothetical protein
LELEKKRFNADFRELDDTSCDRVVVTYQASGGAAIGAGCKCRPCS